MTSTHNSESPLPCPLSPFLLYWVSTCQSAQAVVPLPGPSIAYRSTRERGDSSVFRAHEHECDCHGHWRRRPAHHPSALLRTSPPSLRGITTPSSSTARPVGLLHAAPATISYTHVSIDCRARVSSWSTSAVPPLVTRLSFRAFVPTCAPSLSRYRRTLAS